MSFFGSSSSSSSSSDSDSSSTALKNSLMQQVQAEAVVANAQALIGRNTTIQKINENCFERCVPNPGSSLSSSDSTCLSACVEKYISVWNATSRAYMARVSKESKKMGVGADVMGALGGVSRQ